MKVRAFVVNKATNKYITDPSGRLLQVHAEDAAALKEKYPHEHNRREYRNTRANPKRRQRLKLVTKHETNFYSYIGAYDHTGSEHVDESESHQAVIVALSRLTAMNFYDSNSDLQLDPFTFTEVLVEPKLELANGKVYFPDLLCHFNESHPLYDRWGGKLAIEVTYSHPCENAKIHDFMFHNIPILEVIIEKDSSREYPGERFNWDYYSLSSIENHINILETWFQKFIGVNVLVDPISNRVHEEITTQLSVDLQQLIVENKSTSESLSSLKRKQSMLLEDLNGLRSDKNNLIEAHAGKLQDLRQHFRNKIEKLTKEKLAEEKTRKQISQVLNTRTAQVSYLTISSVVLFLLIVGALLAPMVFRESTIQFLSWYIDAVS